jgi:hypothetical protein
MEDSFEKQIQKFMVSEETQLAFPPTLTQKQRKEIHTIVEKYGLYSYSSGVGNARCIQLDLCIEIDYNISYNSD